MLELIESCSSARAPPNINGANLAKISILGPTATPETNTFDHERLIGIRLLWDIEPLVKAYSCFIH